MSPLERILLGDEDRMAYGTGSSAEMANQPAGLAQLIIGLYNSLGETAKKAIGNSQMAVETGIYNPAPVMEAALLPMGTGAIAGVPVKGAQTVLGAGPIRAYHGSPHDFDRFDLSKIGTGEGAQAYGHGLYFAENEGVARAYKKNLAPAAADIAPAWNGRGWQVTTRDGGNFGREFFPTKEAAEEFAAKYDKGKMYEVNINADPAHFLDWDKPLSGQAQNIQRSLHQNELGNVIPEGRPSGELIKAMQRAMGPERPTQILRDDIGIPGIKYLDQGSRSAGEGSRNFVVFDDKLIDILRKYGIVVAPPVMHPLLSGTEEKS